MNKELIILPPFKYRESDIRILIGHYLKKIQEIHPNIKGISTEAQSIISKRYFLGKITDLYAYLKDAAEDSYEIISHLNLAGEEYVRSALLEENEIYQIENSLLKYKGNKKRAAKELGIDVRTIRNKIKTKKFTSEYAIINPPPKHLGKGKII